MMMMMMMRRIVAAACPRRRVTLRVLTLIECVCLSAQQQVLKTKDTCGRK